MNPNEFSIHDWQFKFNSNMIITENTDEILYAVQKAQEKGRLNNDTVSLIMKWMEHGGEESHEAIMDFLNGELNETDIPPPEAAFSKAPYGDEIDSEETLNKTELDDN